MKIALLTDGVYPYIIGGMQKHSFYLAKYLAGKGVYVDLYHFNSSHYKPEKLEFFTEEEKKYIHSVLLDFPEEDRFPGHYIRASYRYSERVYNEFLKRDNADFIYAKGFSAWKLLEEKKAGKRKFPPVGINFHGYEMFQEAPGLRSGIEQRLFLRSPVKSNAAMADYLFSYGPGISRILAQKLGVSEKKIIEAPSGVEKEKLRTTEIGSGTPRRFLFAGRFERRKGIEELSRALRELKTDDFIFDFAGDIPLPARLNNKNVNYHGKIVDPVKMDELYAKSDILVCPSYAEGMPNVILEAMANGLAVIATDVGAVSSMVDEQNGWLLKRVGVQEIQEALSLALSADKQQIIKKKNASLEKVREHFLWENIIVDIINKLQIIIKNNEY